jgi:hypothetical protein
MKKKQKRPDGSGAFRMKGAVLEISMNFTPTKGRAGWTEIPADPPGVIKVGQVLSDPGGPCDGEVIVAITKRKGE